MMSAGFIDAIIFMVLLGFAMKGYITGFIRSVVTLVAVIMGIAAAATMPMIGSALMSRPVPAGLPNHEPANYLFAFTLFFLVFQSGGFLMTGLLEKIGLGTLDKAIGCVLGIITGVIVGGVPGAAIYRSAAAYAYKPDQAYFTNSFFMKTFTPVTKAIAGKPKKPKAPSK